ncbi:phospholipase D-like domain-containing protein [Photobacterium rosenbergii]|uniref:Phospholipase D-like domain-containing protein n=1 Tax=Photobacterium rosenbergii TaxID=294936 RepID=A0ABU3ZLP6_9GAMM|nr:phospholipase D-like domain-containing protein [Photobacterium rosenbergii]MDV5171041.1 phospholipase D-like domain-containing protein [Photobacterium rosenbergii]
MKVVTESTKSEWEAAIQECKKDLVIYAPYWDKFLLDLLEPVKPKINITIITSNDMSKYITSRYALEALKKVVNKKEYGKTLKIKEYPGLHAKLLSVDGRIISVGSQNFTTNSQERMFEVSVFCSEENVRLAQLESQLNNAHMVMIKKERVEEIEKFVQNHKELRNQLRLMRKEQLLLQQAWHPLRFDKGERAELADQLTFEELFKNEKHDVERSNWIPIFDQQKKYRLHFVRINKNTASFTLTKIFFSDSLDIGHDKEKEQFDFQVSSRADKDGFNVAVTAKVTYGERLYKATIKYCIDFEESIEPEISWGQRIPPEELKCVLLNHVSSGQLLRRIMESFHTSNFLNSEQTKTFKDTFRKAKEVTILTVKSHPVLVIR